MKLDIAFEQLKNKAWADPDFKKQLLSNSKETIVKETGVEIPPDVSVTVHEQKAKDLFFILPVDPNAQGELSDDDLEQVAGGADKESQNTMDDINNNTTIG